MIIDKRGDHCHLNLNEAGTKFYNDLQEMEIYRFEGISVEGIV